MKGILIPVEGDPYEVEVRNGWRSIARKIGCETIEIVRPQSFGSRNVHRGYPVMVVDEEGHVLHRRRNPIATRVYGYQNPGIAGDVLVLGEGLAMDEDGVEDVDLIGLEHVDGITVSELLARLKAMQP